MFSNRPAMGPIRRILIIIAVVAVTAAVEAQERSAAQRLSELEERLAALDRQADSLRDEISRLKADLGLAAEEDSLEVEPLTSEDDLLGVSPVSNPPAAPVSAGPTASSSTIFNPQIAVIGNLIGFAGDSGGRERESFNLEEAEFSYEAYVDPYAKAKFFVGFSDGEAAIEEGYVEFLNVPGDFTIRAGRLKASFGKFNTLHFHQWSTADAPLVQESFFGGEGLADAGVSVSHLFPEAGGWFIEGTGEVFRGEVEDVFSPDSRNDFLYVGKLRTYRDVSDSSNVEIEGSWARGNLTDGAGKGTFYGTDITWRWRPLSRSIYRSFMGRAELIWNDRDDQSEKAFGYYASADYQFARRWRAGLRVDRADRPLDPSMTDEGRSLVLTFAPSEFSLIRGQFRNTDYADGRDANELVLQIQFAIGAHGAHSF